MKRRDCRCVLVALARLRRRRRQVSRRRQSLAHGHRCRRSRASWPRSNEKNQCAKTEQQKAEADLKNIDNELDVAENEYKTAKLQLDTAKLNQKTAEQSGDVNRKNQAQRDVHVAELGVKAADAKVDWLNKKRKWIKAQRDAADDHVAAADARVELEKAKLAQQKGIKPSEDFNVMNFETDNLKKQQKLLGGAHGRRQDAGRRRRPRAQVQDAAVEYNGAKAGTSRSSAPIGIAHRRPATVRSRRVRVTAPTSLEAAKAAADGVDVDSLGCAYQSMLGGARGVAWSIRSTKNRRASWSWTTRRSSARSSPIF